MTADHDKLYSWPQQIKLIQTRTLKNYSNWNESEVQDVSHNLGTRLQMLQRPTKKLHITFCDIVKRGKESEISIIW